MPKSKRAKVGACSAAPLLRSALSVPRARSPPVPLTQAKKKTRENKEKIVSLVRDCVDECVPGAPRAASAGG